MKIIKTNSVDVIVYTSAKELPISRYTEFQKYCALEAGVGSDVDSIISRSNRITAFIEEGKNADAIQEVNNFKLACLSVLNGVGYYTLAFACLVATIGGQVAKDLTETGLLSTVEKLKEINLTQFEIEELVEDVKKKLNQK